MATSTIRRGTTASAVTALALALSLSLTGCGASGGQDGDSAKEPAGISTPSDDSPYEGTALDRPFVKPDLTLTDTSGKPYDLRERTKGRITLLYFGYTHCPDVCPTTLGDIAAAKKKLAKADQEKVDVVFVTTDPDRDTPSHIRSWLKAFDKSIIGLTGDFEEIATAGRSVGVAVEKPEKEKDGDIIVDHGAQVLAYSRDDKAHVLYTAGTEPEKYAHDLPLLIKGVKP